MKQKIPWQCNNVLGVSTGKFFKINHQFIHVGQFNTAPAITISNILPWLTTQRVDQNIDCRGLWKSLPWYYLSSVAGGLILVWHWMSTYGTIYFISFSYHFLRWYFKRCAFLNCALNMLYIIKIKVIKIIYRHSVCFLPAPEYCCTQLVYNINRIFVLLHIHWYNASYCVRSLC